MITVQAHGCFDLLHLGHIRHLQAARAAGDRLIVTVTPDRFVNKGPGRPAFSAAQRAEALRALSCVDDVRITDSPTAADAIREIKPAVFAKGPDYCEATVDQEERQALADVGGTLLITQTEKWSSTVLLQQHGPALPPEIEQYLARIRAQYSLDEVRGYLATARGLKVVVIGDSIVDEYQYCDTLGKAGKDPILAVQAISQECFVGGAEAIAEHARAVADHVSSLTGPPTAKRRFVERYPFQKLFEVYELDERAGAEAGNACADQLQIDGADLVIVADYGHGFLTPRLIEGVIKQSAMLALNVQANAGNHGFNTIAKYERAHFISLSERELRVDARDQRTPIDTLMRNAAAERHTWFTIPIILITRGAKGCLLYKSGSGWSQAPALTHETVDRTGAGDAVFGVCACCAAVGMPLDLLTFIAAVVGTMAVGIVGNASYIERDALWKAIETWMR